MGGKSSGSFSSTKSNSKNYLGNSTTSNPFVISSTNNNGTNSSFVQGSAFQTINDFINDNAQDLLQNYLKPSLNTTTNQELMNFYNNNLNSQSKANLENNIINPLSQRNMIRSSQATDMYNNAQNSINNSIAQYTNELLASSQENTANMLNTLMGMYLNGFNALSSNQAQSLNTSAANGSQSLSSKSNKIGAEFDFELKDFLSNS